MRVNSAIRVLTVGTALLISSLASASDAKYPAEEIERAREAHDKQDCRATWEALWPLAKSGNHDARYRLTLFIVVGRLNPPGRLSTQMLMERALTFAAYSTLGKPLPNPVDGKLDHAWARRSIPNLIEGLSAHSTRQPDADARVISCYRSNEPFKTCLDLGVSLGVIVPFDEIADAIDKSERQTGRSASCAQYPGPPIIQSTP